MEDAVQAQGKAPYYLEELDVSLRPAVANAKGHVHVPEIDHVIECQLVGHAIFQTQEFHDVLTQLNMAAHAQCKHIGKTSDQPFVVVKALRPIKEIQNCDGDKYNCFNLRLISKSLNITKCHAIKRWIESRQKSSEGKPLTHNVRHNVRVDLQDYLQDAFGKCKALKNGDISESEAVKLADELQKSPIKAASDFEGFLEKRAEELYPSYQDYRNLAKRLEKLKETFGDLRNEFENE